MPSYAWMTGPVVPETLVSAESAHLKKESNQISRTCPTPQQLLPLNVNSTRI